MNERIRKTVVKILAAIVTFAGLLVLVGWLLKVPTLKALHPDWISVAPVTALCFVLTGIKLYFIPEYKEGKAQPAQVILTASSLTILLIMVTLLVSYIFNISTGIESLFMNDTSIAPLVGPFSPSVITALSFILIVGASVLTMIRTSNLKRQLKSIGAATSTVGGVAILGYTLKLPTLYYAFTFLVNPMEFYSAALFFLVGIALILISEHSVRSEVAQ